MARDACGASGVTRQLMQRYQPRIMRTVAELEIRDFREREAADVYPRQKSREGSSSKEGGGEAAGFSSLIRQLSEGQENPGGGGEGSELTTH